MEFSNLERAAIEVILSKDMAGMDALRRQFAAASVVKREWVGGTFHLTLSVPRSLPPACESAALHRQLLGGASAEVKSDPDELISFHLWTDVGYLVGFEGGPTKNDVWPDESQMRIVPTFIQLKENTRRRRKIRSWIRKLFPGN